MGDPTLFSFEAKTREGLGNVSFLVVEGGSISGSIFFPCLGLVMHHGCCKRDLVNGCSP